jgi:hypothetical protein
MIRVNTGGDAGVVAMRGAERLTPRDEWLLAHPELLVRQGGLALGGVGVG